MENYKIVIFDLDGTLYKFPDGKKEFGSTEMYAEIKKRGIEFIAKRLKVTIDVATKIRADISAKYKKDISIGLEKEYGVQRTAYFNSAWDVNAKKYLNKDPAIADMLKELRELGYYLVILSAAPKIWIKNVLTAIGLGEGYFDAIYDGEGNVRKPSLKAFYQIIENFEFGYKECIFVDDEKPSLDAAKSLGITTVLVDYCNDDIASQSRYDYSIKDIYGVRKIVLGT